jgi:MoxR-like ATPase
MQYSNIATVSLNQAATIVESLIPHKVRPVFLWGAFGVGKSSIVQSIVASLSEQTGKQWGLIDVRASQLDAVDTRGIPDLVDGRTAFALPDWLPRVDRDGEQGILFTDELLLGSASVQASLYQLINDRQLGDYVLPEGWRIIAASNRSCDGAGVHGRQDAALMTRFSVQLNVVPDVDEWVNFAGSAGYAPEVIAFIANRGKPVLKGNGSIDQAGLLHEYP